jgi:hypothetical protein
MYPEVLIALNPQLSLTILLFIIQAYYGSTLLTSGGAARIHHQVGVLNRVTICPENNDAENNYHGGMWSLVLELRDFANGVNLPQLKVPGAQLPNPGASQRFGTQLSPDSQATAS